MDIAVIVFYILLIDAFVAILLAFGGKQTWWQVTWRPIARHFPLTRGWTTYYLILVLLMGWMLYRGGLLTLPF